ncbi:MAG: DNA-directed RNA polymerase subunit beta' [candidate division BRC1 bacterium ADurb.Bin183]|nr:MAG: DNA-directed RNA polymerase subunit beta' [candidate division BRC1 bacterium ADurb.Bin183]
MNKNEPEKIENQTILLGLDKDFEEVDLNMVNATAKISIASPDQILQWSRRHCRQTDRRGVCKCGKTAEEQALCPFGEVKKPETINYRTFKPEKDGLFCERIFGPVKDWECACGKYKRIKYKGIICDRCGVEVTESKVRRIRMGHIKLATPVCHIWFYKGTSSPISNLLDISIRDIGKVIYYQDYIVVDPGESPLRAKQILSEEEYRKYKDIYADRVKIMIGAEAVMELMKQLDIEGLAKNLAIEMRNATSMQRRSKIIKRLKVVEAFRGSENKPEWMVMNVLPVIPPDLRPLVHLDGGRFATSDLNDLYRRVINRNNRLKRLIELKAPDVILRNERRMLQESVDALFDNSRRSRPTKGHNNRPLKSLSDMLKGKQGRFRQNLLGKRVDYSGRSVIVVGPELNFNECGIPKKMALELFDPFIIRELQRQEYAHTIKNAKKMIEAEEPIVYDILEQITRNHPVLLNRAPTLHRLGIQAFRPVLVEGKAIRLHPLSCAAFNADFDGDQMAVHVPLSTESQMEAHLIMMAQNNILSPSNGRPISVPSQDIVLGCFYLTKMRQGVRGEGMRFASPEEAILAHNLNIVHLQAEVTVRIDGKNIKTSPGRIIFNQILPKKISYFNDDMSYSHTVLSKRHLAALIAMAHKTCGAAATAELLDKIKELGYYHAQRAGISICVADMIVPPTKEKILEDAKKEVRKVQLQYEKGVLTDEERYHKIIDIWTNATDTVGQNLIKVLQNDQNGLNPIYIMANSGARGSEQQIRQLAGMRGLMQRPTKKVTGAFGEIIESPIQSNFREGLTVLEYFISTHGARKGLADTALKTSDAGYLTRRLVDVAQDLIITEEDCGTFNGIKISSIKEITIQGERELEPLRDRIVGRFPIDDVINPTTGEVICRRDQEITEDIAHAIEDAGFDALEIRSVLTCESRQGVCIRCYGRNMATQRLVEVGEATGIIAAQSIGEPGTQLTLRTFHIGGTASRELEGWYQAAFDGRIKFINIRYVTREDGTPIVTNRTGSIHVEEENGARVQILPNVPYGARIRRKEGSLVKQGERFVDWDPHYTPIITDIDGHVRFIDIIQGITMKEDIDPVTGIAQMLITEHREDLHPMIQIIVDGEVKTQYALSAGAIISREIMEEGAPVKAGQTLARLPRLKAKTHDITGGLPRVDELFEARKPKDCAFIADIDGVFHFKGISKGARKAYIKSEIGEEHQYTIPLLRHVIVRDGESLRAGDRITDGSISPHDILRVRGEKAVQEFLLSEIQEVYRLQGVKINDKHIECIIRQMLKKVTIEEVGNTEFLFGQQVDKWRFQEANRLTIAEGGEPATAKPKLLGITKASLGTESFISAASFQETTRVLTDAAIRGRRDYLRGLKENVIMGLLIPAGTGIPRYRNIQVEAISGEKDKLPPAPAGDNESGEAPAAAAN